MSTVNSRSWTPEHAEEEYVQNTKRYQDFTYERMMLSQLLFMHPESITDLLAYSFS